MSHERDESGPPPTLPSWSLGNKQAARTRQPGEGVNMEDENTLRRARVLPGLPRGSEGCMGPPNMPLPWSGSQLSRVSQLRATETQRVSGPCMWVRAQATRA